LLAKLRELSRMELGLNQKKYEDSFKHHEDQWIGLRFFFYRKTPYISWGNPWFPVKIFRWTNPLKVEIEPPSIGNFRGS
jgi:hypothetical protein